MARKRRRRITRNRAPTPNNDRGIGANIDYSDDEVKPSPDDNRGASGKDTMVRPVVLTRPQKAGLPRVSTYGFPPPP